MGPSSTVSLVQSLLTGTPGHYTVSGIKVRFKPYNQRLYCCSNGGGRSLQRLADYCLHARVFQMLTLTPLHIFIHEMGHAVVYKFFTGLNAKVVVISNACSGYTSFPKRSEIY